MLTSPHQSMSPCATDLTTEAIQAIQIISRNWRAAQVHLVVVTTRMHQRALCILRVNVASHSVLGNADISRRSPEGKTNVHPEPPYRIGASPNRTATKLLVRPGLTMTCPGIFRPNEFRDNGFLSVRSGYEEGTIFGRTDCSDIAGSGSRSRCGSRQTACGQCASIYAWRKRFGDMGPDDVKRLRSLEQENGRLKKILAERDLEIEVMKEITAKKW